METIQWDDPELVEHLAKVHPVKMYQHLIDHVNGLGERHWDQTDYLGKGEQYLEARSKDYQCTARSLINVCGTTACVAGEAVLHAGIDCTEDGRFSFKGQSLPTTDWDNAAEFCGVERQIGNRLYLFSGGNTRDQVLTELEIRLADELAR